MAMVDFKTSADSVFSLNQPKGLSDEEFRLFGRLIYEHSGISLRDDKKDLLRARLGRRIRNSRFRSYGDYYDYIVQDKTGRELIHLIDSISTNLTYFFREEKHFQFIEQTIMPQLIESQKNSGNNRLRFWSAACSSGEEPYSLAMTVLPLVRQNTFFDFKILASDISTKILATARSGVYAREKVKNMNPFQVKMFFDPHPNGLAVKEEIKRAITFTRINLLEPWPFKGPFEVILSRNVMIYFDKPTQERLIQRFWDNLTPGGYLFVGHSESLVGINSRFRYVCPAVYQK